LAGEETAEDEHGEGDADVGEGEEGCEFGYANCEEDSVPCLIGSEAVIWEMLVLLHGAKRDVNGRRVEIERGTNNPERKRHLGSQY
jgi:hypothetical protein